MKLLQKRKSAKRGDESDERVCTTVSLFLMGMCPLLSLSLSLSLCPRASLSILRRRREGQGNLPKTYVHESPHVRFNKKVVSGVS